MYFEEHLRTTASKYVRGTIILISNCYQEYHPYQISSLFLNFFPVILRGIFFSAPESNWFYIFMYGILFEQTLYLFCLLHSVYLCLLFFSFSANRKRIYGRRFFGGNLPGIGLNPFLIRLKVGCFFFSKDNVYSEERGKFIMVS